MSRLGFFGRVVVRGIRWLLSLTDVWSKVGTLAAIVGVSFGVIHFSHFRPWLAVVIVAMVVVILLAEGAYREWLEADTARLAAEEKAGRAQQGGSPTPATAPLVAHYEQREPYLHTTSQAWIFEHRIGIHNPVGNQTATHVRLELIDMSPRPRDLPPKTPCAVPLLRGGDERIGISLPPGQQEYWVIGSSATGSDGTISAGLFSTRDPRWQGTPWPFDPTYPWRFTYQVVADGVPDERFSVVMTAAEGRIRYDLER